MSYQRDFSRRLDVAVVGVGSHAYRNILPALHFLPVRLRAVCDLNLDLARKTAAEYGDCRAYSSTRAMYDAEKLDAVFLVAGPKQHVPLAIEAFGRGLHVWTEKPVAMRAADVEQMIAARGDRACVVGFKKAFMPAARKVMEVIASPRYGRLHSMLAVYPMEVPANGREVLESGTFTNWLGNGVHPLSLMLAAGGPVRSVCTLRGPVAGGAVVLEFASGVMGTFHLARGPQPIERYEFFGETWHMAVDNSLRVVLQRGIPFDYGVTTDYTGDETSGALVWEPQNCLATLENMPLYTQGMMGALEHFCACALEGKRPERGNLEFALQVMRVYEAALLSQGERVAVQQDL